MFTLEDVSNLETQYHAARDAVDQVVYRNGYPIYPDTLEAFMLSLTSAPWGNRAYQPNQITRLLDQIDGATKEEVRSILTAFSRGERFSPGHWLDVLQSDAFNKMIQRAKTLARIAE